MAPNLTLHKRVLIQSIVNSKLQGDDDLKDDEIADVAGCSARAVRRIRSNLLRFGTMTAPPNGAGRPKTIDPPMLTALCDQLSLNPCMRLEDMADFLRSEFDVDVTRFSIGRSLKRAKWWKKCTQNVARERNPDLRDEYVHEISFLRSEQLVFIDETGVDRSIGTKLQG
ncbi:hypothetical protein QBC34DRAFT_376501 [Podospora aff. communis PSN243]|uniref:Winged helix-turn helix domain-containing protein n=1 Tax=Podospora aff. communis PSN243 TaxID=3040156 RepID=A0AAV9GXU9_9PEZI|nr:hypothetical protein QBC34DRAFT_376501 [Podospora aff. communis PSN243]